MTTIAYKDGVIAYDSRAGDSDSVDKRSERKGICFVFAGWLDYRETLIGCWFRPLKRVEIDEAIHALVVDQGQLWRAVLNSTGFSRHRVEDRILAIGSGSKFAIEAMQQGKSAEQAVEASKQDIYTGGTVHTIRLNQ